MFSDNAERIAQADVLTPTPELTAHGAITVNGSADVPARSGPPTPRRSDPPTPPSPARAALHNHQQELVELQANHQRASKPVDFLRTKLVIATADLSAAESELAKIDAAHSAALARAAREGTEVPAPPSSADAEARLARARRNTNSVRQALAECQQDQAAAAAALEGANARFGALALAVLVEEHAACLLAWQDASAACFAAEAAVLGLEAAIGERGRELAQNGNLLYLQRLEALRQPIAARDGLGPRDLAVAAQRWSAVLQRLQSDPGAGF